MKFYEYAGMSYERASREAERLIRRGWFRNFERLEALRWIMQREDVMARRPKTLKRPVENNAHN